MKRQHFIFLALRMSDFTESAIVINGSKHIDTSAPLMPRIFGMLIAGFRKEFLESE